ncbi:ATP-binding protein, partial [Reticulomyxa filosa]
MKVVQERQKQMKHQQMVSGMSFVSYWCGQFVIDLLVALFTCLLLVAIVHIYNVKGFLGEAEPPFIVSILLFLISVLPLTYVLSFLFDSPNKAQGSLAALYILLGLMFAIVTFVLMNINSDTVSANNVLKYFFRASPPYCLAYSLIFIFSKSASGASSFFQNESYWNYNLIGKNLVAMAVNAILYFSFLLLIEYMSAFPTLMTKLGFNIDIPKE